MVDISVPRCLYVLIMVSMLATLLGCQGLAAPPVPPSALLTAVPSEIQSGQSTVLTWQTQGAALAVLDGVGSVPLSGSLPMTPKQTTTYRLTSRGPGGELVAQASVTVLPPPPVATLAAVPTTINAGQSATLSWQTQNATAVTIDGLGAVAASGSQTVKPAQTITYHLIAQNDGGSQTATVTITVTVPPPPPNPTPVPQAQKLPPPPNPATSPIPNMYMPPVPAAVSVPPTTVKCEEMPGTNAGEKIAACIEALGSSGGTADATAIPGADSINVNVFTNASGPGRLLLGKASFLVCTTQTIPSNWEVAGAGATTVFVACPNRNLPLPSNAVLSNLHNETYDPKVNHDHNIVIHDLVVDGNSGNNPFSNTPLQQGIVLRGADYSEIYNVTVQNTNLNGIDVRDGFGIKVHDNVASNAGNHDPYHSIGGGLSGPHMFFNGNSFTNNKASGGQNIDHYDIFGQYGTCVGNDFIGNESNNAPLQSLIYDTCSWGRIQNNVLTGSAKDALAITSGSASQLSENLLISGNILNHPRGNGILLRNQVNRDTITNNTIQSPGWNGLFIIQSSANEIAGNHISGPGWSTTQHFSGINLTTVTTGFASSNNIHDNTITDACANTMLYGISLLPQNGGHVFANVLDNNLTTGGGPGNTGKGINDSGQSTSLSGNQYNEQSCP